MIEDFSSPLLLTLLNNLHDATYIIDNKGKTLFANNATLELYQCSWSVYDKLYSDIYFMDQHGTFSKNLYPLVLEKKAMICGWHKIFDINHNYKLFFTWNAPVFDGDGNVKYVVGQSKLRDRVESEYITAQNSLSDFFSLQLKAGSEKKSFIYNSKVMTDFVNGLSRVAKTDVPILLQGETGVGKEVLATHLHEASDRRNRDMISINCAAISPTLFESEVFGYTRGAFTGCDPKGKLGLIEAANHSTLFLDEIESMPLDQQGKLLRVLETKTIYKVGGSKPIPVDFRLIAATNKNIPDLISEGKFREDLYYRLNVVPAVIPPLRERREDIRPLVDYYLERYCTKYGLDKHCSESAYQQLENYSWPGNVRELKNLMERLVLTSDLSVHEINGVAFSKDSFYSGAHTSPTVLPDGVGASPSAATVSNLNNQMDKYERSLIETALKASRTSSEAAVRLGISVATMSRKMAKYGL